MINKRLPLRPPEGVAGTPESWMHTSHLPVAVTVVSTWKACASSLGVTVDFHLHSAMFFP